MPALRIARREERGYPLAKSPAHVLVVTEGVGAHRATGEGPLADDSCHS
jgi:hypothetical protein